jgi:hypothetical protein
MVGREGIEPPQSKTADLQSAELTTCSTYPRKPTGTWWRADRSGSIANRPIRLNGSGGCLLALLVELQGAQVLAVADQQLVLVALADDPHAGLLVEARRAGQ